MIEKKDILADLHIHTIGSEHAYSTLYECIRCAADAGLKYIAITDHYYNDGTKLHKINEINRFIYLEKEAARAQNKVHVLGGAEFNIGQNIESWEKLKELSWKMIGVHGMLLNVKEFSYDDIYRFYEQRADDMDCFSHIERNVGKIGGYNETELTDDIRNYLYSLVTLAKEKNVVLEVNESTLFADEPGDFERMKFWLNYAKSNGNLISLGSDSHYCELIGKFERALDLLNAIDFPKDRIVNCNPDLLNNQKTAFS